MQQPKRIPGRISPDARKVLLEFLERAGSKEAVICLMKGHVGDDKGCIGDRSEEKWVFGTYEPENIKSVERDLSRMGHCLLYELDKMILAIPQSHKLDEVIDKEMIWNERELVFQDCSA